MMLYHDCDQIGNDLFVAAETVAKKSGEPCRLSLEVGEWLVQEVERLDRSSYRLADTIDYTLNNTYVTAIEREAYRIALLKIFGRRKGAARDERRRLEAATDFPRGQEL